MLKVIGTDAKIHWLSNEHNNGKLTKNQGILYATFDKKLGKADAESYAGLTPAEAFERRYGGQKSSMISNFIATDFFVFDKVGSDPDDGARELIHSLFEKRRIQFDALYPGYQLPNMNSEALVGFDRDTHLDDLVNVVKQYFKLSTTFDTKDPIVWRYMQAEDIDEIIDRLKQHKLCLYAAYTSRGKTKISIEAAVCLCQQGGIVLVTTPITDTKKSFEDNINDYHFGLDRNLVVTYMDSTEFVKHSVTELRARADAGELIFIVLTVQDARYKDSGIADDVAALREKYEKLSGNVDLWIRDERHFQYSGEITSKRLSNLVAKYELDLTATPYSVLDKYKWDHIVSRTLLWGLKYQTQTKLPIIRIECINTLITNISDKIAGLYSEAEGFDPRKLVARENKQFVLEAEIIKLRDLFYHSTLSKRKNPLSISNDTQLSSAAKKCGMWVLPSGQDGDGANEYIPDLAKLLTTDETYFVDSYSLEKDCPKHLTIGEYIESLSHKYNRVIILTCGKFLTGTDIPVLGHVVLLDKMDNIANFEQLLGRMIREYPGKGKVKLYAFAPGADLKVVLGRMAKANSVLGGGSEYEMLECIPLTEYVVGENDARTITANETLASTQDWFKQEVQSKLPSYSLQNELSSADLSDWNDIDLSKFKKQLPKTSLTDDNGAKVKVKVSINAKTGTSLTKQELTTLEQVERTIQAVFFEAQWVAYSLNNYDYQTVLSNSAIKAMFGDNIVQSLLALAESNDKVKQMFGQYMLSKQLAYASLPIKDVYPNIFNNSELKKSIGLVYIEFSLADLLVADLDANKYNNSNTVIAVVNALNGILPLTLKEKFPNAKIVCIEYFDYFVDHLTRLGFEVINLDNLDELMKFDIVIGNPPYQSGNGEKGGARSLWRKFIKKSFALCKDDGYVSMVCPGFPYQSNDLGSCFTKNTPLILNNDVTDHFPNIGSEIKYWVVKKGTHDLPFIVDGTVWEDGLAVDPTMNHTLRSIKDKISQFETFECKQDRGYSSTQFKNDTEDYFDQPQGDSIYPIRHASNVKVCYVKQPTDCHTKRKVMMTFSGYPAFEYYDETTPMSSCYQMSGYIEVPDKAVGEALIKVYQSKLYTFLSVVDGAGMKSVTNYSLPKLDLTREWTNQEIYDYFGLTDSEIEYVEQYQ
jgi:hypothetical protein